MSEPVQKQEKHAALFISALRKGGSERVLVNLAEYLNENGVRVTMVNQYEGQDEYELSPAIRRVYSEITDQETGRSRILNFVRRFRKLRKIWKTEKPDVILSFIGKNNIMMILTSRFLHIPAVVSVRGEPKEEYASRLLRLLVNPCFARADGVVLQTREAASFFSEKVQKKAVILKNPLHPDFVRPRFEGERDKTVYAVGRVDANKNHEMLIRSFAALAEDFPEHRLVIYGKGDCRDRLLRLVDELGMEGRISLPGSVNDVAERICRGSAFVLCSNSEGMPNTLIEAMCMGLPVISTDCPCGGPGELIRNGENGLLIAPGDGAGLERALRRILGNEEEAGEMGRRAAKLLKEYDPRQVGAEWMDYLLGLAGTENKAKQDRQ